jgi:glycosyltransferase involved in cell wall biosynthesis
MGVHKQEPKTTLIMMPVMLRGGTEFQVLSLVQVLVRAGYTIKVCCYYEYDEAVASIFRKNGAQVILMGLKRKDGLWNLSKKLRQLLKQISPDIVHVQYLAPAFVPIVTAWFVPMPVIFATVHIAGTVAYGWKAKFLLRMASRFCTTLFCVSKGVEEFWFGNSEVFNPENSNRYRKHFTIYNTIDIPKIDQIVNSLGREELKRSLGTTGKQVLGIVGRLCKQKGQTILLDALTEVVNRFQATMLFIVGDGPDKAELQEKANRLGLDKYIRWFGALPQEEVFRLYAAMDVLVMPSLYEGFGLTAAEAMAAGLPVVGTRVDGLSEIIEENVTGYLLPAGDSHELVKVLIEILSNPGKREMMGQKGKDRVQELFSLERFNRSILAAYDKLSRH